jgi:hypothetical protein
MKDMELEARNGFNAFLESQQKLPGEARLTLVLFDHEYIVAHDGVPIKDALPLDEHTYVPRGTTALLDAIGRTINTIGERLDKTPEAERPAKVIVAILTDGLENASQEFKRKQIFKMIKHQREVYGRPRRRPGNDPARPDIQASYRQAQKDARAKRLGLWMDPNPIPPWKFRREARKT